MITVLIYSYHLKIYSKRKMYSRINIIYLFLILSVITLFISNQVQTTYGDVIPKSHFDILTYLALFIITIIVFPFTRVFILK